MPWKQLRDADWKIPYVGGWCEGFVEGSWGQATLPAVNNQITYGKYASAIAKWNANPGNGNHPGELPPEGVTVPVYFSLGSTSFGHTADSLSDGMVASSTQGGFHTQGYIHPNLQNLIDVYAKYNKGCTYLGWSEYVGDVQVVEWVNPNATTDQVNRAYLDILERPADADGLAHYTSIGMTDNQVRADLLDSAEYKALQKHKADVAAAQAADAAAKQAAADAKAKADAEAAAKAQAEADAKAEAVKEQDKPKPVTVPVQNQPAKQSLYDLIANIVVAAINWLKQWRKS